MEDCQPIISCGQTSIPEVDETQINCESISTTDCINTVKDYLSLQVLEGAPLTDLLDKLVDKSLSFSQLYLILRPTTEPTTPAAGTLYTDVTTGRLRHYNGVTDQWEDFYAGGSGGSSTTRIINEQTNLTSPTFTLPSAPIVNSQDVSFNGRLVEPSGYTISGNTVTFTKIPYTNIVATDIIVTTYEESNGSSTSTTRIINEQTNLTTPVITLPSTPITNSQDVFFNGRLVEISAYTISGTTITFTDTPYTDIEATDIITITYNI